MSRSSNLVYISYRWDGSKALADKLARRLVRDLANRAEVFHDYTSLAPGDTWPAAYRDALSRTTLLILLIDRNWVRHADEYGRRKIDNKEDWVRLELEYALTHEIKIFPILVDDAKMPPAMALPDTLTKLPEFMAMRCHTDTFEADYSSLLQNLMTFFAREPNRTSVDVSNVPFRVLDIEINNFRCFKELHVDLSGQSKLPGNWTCIAGLNGAGKTTILQALSLILMGPDNVRELGGARVASLQRRVAEGRKAGSAVIKARVSHLGEVLTLEMALNGKNVKSNDRQYWSRFGEPLMVGYGASRNLSDSPDKYDELSPVVRSCIGLFDSRARLENGERLLNDSTAKARIARHLLKQVVKILFREEFSIVEERLQGLRFRTASSSTTSPLSAIDLPDGFRSSVAWIADLCKRWSDIYPSNLKLSRPKDIYGVAMIDEIDLHLHASLQRSIITRLRQAFPKVQFIVTSHSPLVLSSFDMQELVILDTKEADGIRELDRQVLGFTADQVYEWLLGTPASSEALEVYLADPKNVRGKDISDVIGVAPDVSTQEAKQRMDRIKNRIGRIQK